MEFKSVIIRRGKKVKLVQLIGPVSVYFIVPIDFDIQAYFSTRTEAIEEFLEKENGSDKKSQPSANYFISDLEDWIKENKYQETGGYSVVDVSELEQLIINF